MKPGGRGLSAPGTGMAVHRADQRGGQGIRDGYPAGVGACPTSPPNRVRDSGTDATGSRNEAWDSARPHPGMVGGIIPEWVGRVAKSRAPVRALAGAPHVAQARGAGSARHSCNS